MARSRQLPAYEDPERDYSMTIEQVGKEQWRIVFTMRGQVIEQSVWDLLDAVHQRAAPRRERGVATV